MLCGKVSQGTFTSYYPGAVNVLGWRTRAAVCGAPPQVVAVFLGITGLLGRAGQRLSYSVTQWVRSQLVRPQQSEVNVSSILDDRSSWSKTDRAVRTRRGCQALAQPPGSQMLQNAESLTLWLHGGPGVRNGVEIPEKESPGQTDTPVYGKQGAHS